MPNFTDGQQVMQWFTDKIEKLTEESKDVIREAVREGEALTKEHIETRGTEKSGKAGRIDTGRMLDAVGSEITKDSDTEIEGAFGWIGDRAQYFQFQELGTSAIEPMYALSDAAEQVERDISRKIGQAVQGV